MNRKDVGATDSPSLAVPYLQDADFTLYNGDAATVLAGLPDESVHMCVTSPPFFGLRDYGVEGQIGLEATPEDWVAQLVAVFEQVRRVLRSDGTLWVECGDSYGANTQGSPKPEANTKGNVFGEVPNAWGGSQATPIKHPAKPKDLIGQPFLLAFALREAGWYWRNVCIWHKPNPMPESVRDRFTVAHSYVLLFSKSPRYFFDAEAVREGYEMQPQNRFTNGTGWKTAPERNGRVDGLALGLPAPQTETLDGSEGEAPRGPDGRRATAVKQGDNSLQHRDGERWPNSGRNARSVWTIPTEPLPFEHYAAFPQALAERCIKAGTSERGCCPECGAPWVREVEVESSWRSRAEKGATRGNLAPDGNVGTGTQVGVHGIGVSHDLGAKSRMLLDWLPSCDCADGKPLVSTPSPCTVLDPFLGAGTTALVARRLGRRCIGIELNETYCKLAAQRTQQLSLEASA